MGIYRSESHLQTAPSGGTSFSCIRERGGKENDKGFHPLYPLTLSYGFILFCLIRVRNWLSPGLAWPLTIVS